MIDTTDEEIIVEGRRRIKLPGDQLGNACRSFYDAATAKTLRWGYNHAISADLTWADCREEFGIDRFTMTRVWTGKPEAGEVQTVLKSIERLKAKTPVTLPLYAKTSISKDIMHLANRARRFSEQGNGGLFLLAGQTGIGKTITTKAWYEDNRDCADFYEFDNGGGKKHVIYGLAALNNLSKYAHTLDITPRVADCYYPGRVLVVDEMDLTMENRNNPTGVIEYLRRLADIRKFSIILSGRFDRFINNVKLSHYDIKQLIRRCKHTLLIDGAGKENDIEILFTFKCPQLTYTTEVATMLKAINRHKFGGFGGIANVIDVAVDFAKNECREEFTHDHLITTVDNKLKMMNRIEKELPTEEEAKH